MHLNALKRKRIDQTLEQVGASRRVLKSATSDLAIIGRKVGRATRGLNKRINRLDRILEDDGTLGPVGAEDPTSFVNNLRFDTRNEKEKLDELESTLKQHRRIICTRKNAGCK